MRTILSLFVVLFFIAGCGGNDGNNETGFENESFENVVDCIAERYPDDSSADICHGTELPEGETIEYTDQMDPALSLYINGRFSLYYKQCNYVSEGDYVYREITGDGILDCFCIELDEFPGTVACSSSNRRIPCRSCFTRTSGNSSENQKELKHLSKDIFNSLLVNY